MTMLWVQVHDIPIHYMSIEVVETICGNVGRWCTPLGQKQRRGGSFFKVRIKVDISLPLCRGRLVTFEEGNKSWVSFKYE